MRAVTLVAKGPSAEHAMKWIGNPKNGQIATINDAAKVLDPRWPVHLTFLTDRAAIDTLEVLHRGTSVVAHRYVCPEWTLGGDTPKWFRDCNPVTYKEHRCCGDDKALTKRIMSGGICHHNTVNGALHWICKYGKFDRVRIIGVDGGSGYASNLQPVTQQRYQDIAEELGDDFLSQWREITKRLCVILKRVYGTEFEWYGG